METTRTSGPLPPPSEAADPLAGLRERLHEDVPRIAAETGCDEAVVLALFSSRIERAIPEAASPAIVAPFKASMLLQVNTVRERKSGSPAGSVSGHACILPLLG